jgi:hypothetical protein
VDWTDLLEQPNERKNMRFGTWNMRKLYKSGSLTAVPRGLATETLYLVRKQEDRRDKTGAVKAGDYIFLYGKRNENH